MVHPWFATAQVWVDRFTAEAKTAASIGHPGVVRVTDTGNDRKLGPFTVAELVDGGSLRDPLDRRGALRPAEAAEHVAQAADALAAAHAPRRHPPRHQAGQSPARRVRPRPRLRLRDRPPADGRCACRSLRERRSGYLWPSSFQTRTRAIGAQAMRQEGRTQRIVVATWVACGVLLTLTVILARPATRFSPSRWTFAGGALFASVADTLMLEAFEHDRPLNAFRRLPAFSSRWCWPQSRPPCGSSRPFSPALSAGHLRSLGNCLPRSLRLRVH